MKKDKRDKAEKQRKAEQRKDHKEALSYSKMLRLKLKMEYK